MRLRGHDTGSCTVWTLAMHALCCATRPSLQMASQRTTDAPFAMRTSPNSSVYIATASRAFPRVRHFQVRASHHTAGLPVAVCIHPEALFGGPLQNPVLGDALVPRSDTLAASAAPSLVMRTTGL